jgi:hypothetical protein
MSTGGSVEERKWRWGTRASEPVVALLRSRKRVFMLTDMQNSKVSWAANAGSRKVRMRQSSPHVIRSCNRGSAAIVKSAAKVHH